MINPGDELVEDYLAECREHLAAIEKGLLSLENGGAEMDAAVVNRIFRAMHLVAGGAILFDLVKIGELARQTEDVLALMRSGKMVAGSDRIDVLLRATDRLRELVENAGAGDQGDIADVMAALVELQAGRPLRVLLVEDDFASRLMMQTFLSRYGDCHVASNGREAVDAFRSASERAERYDLICMDIMMPEMDGLEAVRRVRAQEEADGILSTRGAKIIMTTAVDDIKEVGRCYNELCDAYLVKPIDLAKLLGQMRSWQLTR
jgi:two-component system chemotaxis response regulator CheY